jgi:hypothetical protein
LALVEKNTPMLIEVIDNQSFSVGPITHEIEALDVTIGFQTNKVVFNIISFLKNLVIIGLSWLTLHNPRVVTQGVFTLKHHNMRP